MLKLTNISDADTTLEKFNHSTAAIERLLKETCLDGLELIRWNQTEEHVIPKDKVIGIHLSFWPMWLDFWRGDKAELLRQFGSEENIRGYFLADTKEAFIANYRREFIEAEERGAQYVVFHVGHAELEHTYTYRYTYQDAEIISATIDLLNEILDGLPVHYHILLENLWYSGLTFLQPHLAESLLKKIHYDRLGFVLDIGHLINTNIELKSETEAVQYIKKVLHNLGDLKSHIKTIHLNGSLTGAYVKESMARPQYRKEDDFYTRLFSAMGHVGKIDRHVPFTHPAIKEIIDDVGPSYLVYELASKTMEELKAMILAQNQALK